METTLILTGDVNLRHVADPGVPFGQRAGSPGNGDVVFGNLEGCLYDSDEELAYKQGWYHAGTANALALSRIGFDAVGCANNVTFGSEAILATLARLDEMGIAHTGAGTDRRSARAPTVLVRNGIRFGFIQYTSVFWPIGHEATDSSPGVAALRAHTSYQPHRRILEMPGGPATVVTWPDADDLKEYQEDVRSLRRGVDVLVASHHWGISDSHETADYQVALGHAAVDAGADIVIGHGPHEVQAIEVYRGRPIFYSLGNFVFGKQNGRYDWVGLAVRAELEGTNIVRVACSPVRPDEEGRTAVRTVSQEPDTLDIIEALSRRFGTTLDVKDERLVVWQAGN